MNDLSLAAKGESNDLNRQISHAALGADLEERVHDGLRILERVMISRCEHAGAATTVDAEVVEVEADDLFHFVTTVMELPDPAARRIGMTGLASAFDAEDFAAFQISCLAIQRFCLLVEQPSTAAH